MANIDFILYLHHLTLNKDKNVLRVLLTIHGFYGKYGSIILIIVSTKTIENKRQFQVFITIITFHFSSS